MKRLLFILLMMTCSVSCADWEFVDATDNFLSYVDKKTRKKKGNDVRMWEMRNYFKDQFDSSQRMFLSEKILSAFDCTNGTWHIVAAARYSGLRGEGAVVSSITLSKEEIRPSQVFPGSIAEASWEIACGKK
jgi:hypothetical protein